MGGGLRWPDSFVVQTERVTAAALLSLRAGCLDAKFVPFQPQAAASHYRLPLIFPPFPSYFCGMILFIRSFFSQLIVPIFSPLLFMLRLDMFLILFDSKEWIHSRAGRLLYLLLSFLCFICSAGPT